MRLIGYACLNLSVKDYKFRSCRLKNADLSRLREITENNLTTLKKILEYNKQKQLKLFRISSDIIPFGSHKENNFNWRLEFKKELCEIKKIIAENNFRVSMHPGQYTVLNSPNEEIAASAVKDLEYHCNFLDSVTTNSTHKLILHIGGIYNDKANALKRFIDRWKKLNYKIKKRLIIENDEKNFSITEVLKISSETGIPVVFDNLHHEINNPDKLNQFEAVNLCKLTWQESDGRQKIHYSQQDNLKHRGAHSATISPLEFFEFYNNLPPEKPDIMLEVKDKNLSAEKINALLKNNLG